MALIAIRLPFCCCCACRQDGRGRAIQDDGVLAIIGVGLIGGSIGLAAKAKGLFAEVRGTARHKSSLDTALAAGAIDTACLEASEAARGATLVVVATPVSDIPKYCLECAAAAREGAIVTDVGSVKAKIDAAVRPRMPKGRYYIGSHPMAGSEKRGVANARAELLAGATCIITPTETTDARHSDALSEFWQAMGMKVFRMAPAEHDAVVADVSHLPHIVASALIAAVGDGALPFGASGLRDTTRVAAGDASLWREIIEANNNEVIASIERFERELEKVKQKLLLGDYDGLEEYLRKAADRRRKRFNGGAS